MNTKRAKTLVRRWSKFVAIFSPAFAVGLASAATYTVTNTSGDPSVRGSLPWALSAAYYGAGADSVVFSIPGQGPHEIALTAAQPIGDASGTNGTELSGNTQPGYNGQPKIYINCNQLGAGFNIVGSNNTFKGLCIYNFKTVGVAVLGAANNCMIADNWIGFKPSGSGYVTNNAFGHSTSIGLAIEGPSNVVTNNTISGVYNAITMGKDPVVNPTSNYFVTYSNYISGNRIGMDPSGTAVIGNTQDGVFLGDGASYNVIAYNTIGGQASAGVEILGRTGWANYVYGNLIGVGNGGQRASNGELGVLVSNGSQVNYIGVWVSNYIFYNGLGGVSLGLNAPAAGTVGPTYVNYVDYNVIYANNPSDKSQGVGIACTGGSSYNEMLGNNIYGHAQHGIIVSGAWVNYIYYNYLGYYDWNGGFGVFLQNGGYNAVVGNAFYYNYLGTVGNQGSVGDYIQ